MIICLFLGALWAPEQSTCDLPQCSGEYSTQGWQSGAITLTYKSDVSWWQWTGQIILFYALCELKRRGNVSSPTLAYWGTVLSTICFNLETYSFAVAEKKWISIWKQENIHLNNKLKYFNIIYKLNAGTTLHPYANMDLSFKSH